MTRIVSSALPSNTENGHYDLIELFFKGLDNEFSYKSCKIIGQVFGYLKNISV